MEYLDVVIASMHLPCLKAGTKQENTQAAIAAIQNPNVDILGHPDDGRYPMDYEPIVRAAKQYGKLLEVNNSSLQPNGYRINARENYRSEGTRLNSSHVSISYAVFCL